MLSFVFSTKSLTLGVNMPIKSVVFLAAESLNSVTYRQVSGRAGRRGKDTLGHVVFCGFNKSSIQELHLDPSPKIQTETALDVTTVLKCMVIVHANDYLENKFEPEPSFERLSHLLHQPLQVDEVESRVQVELFLKANRNNCVNNA